MNPHKAPRQAETLMVLEYYRQLGLYPLKLEEIQLHTGLNPDRTRRLLKDLEKKGLVIIKNNDTVELTIKGIRSANEVFIRVFGETITKDSLNKPVDELLREFRNRLILRSSKPIKSLDSWLNMSNVITTFKPTSLSVGEAIIKMFSNEGKLLIGDSWALGADLEHAVVRLERQEAGVYAHYAKDLSWVIRNHRLLAVTLPLWYAGKPVSYNALREAISASWYWPNLKRTSKDLGFYVDEAASHNLLLKQSLGYEIVLTPVDTGVVKLIEKILNVLESPTMYIAQRWPTRVLEAAVYSCIIRNLVSLDELLNNPPGNSTLAEIYSYMSPQDYRRYVERAVKTLREIGIVEEINGYLIPTRVLRYEPALKDVLRKYEESIVLQLLRALVAIRPYPTIDDIARTTKVNKYSLQNTLRMLHERGIIIMTVNGVLTPYHVAYYTMDPLPRDQKKNYGNEALIRVSSPILALYFSEMKKNISEGDWEIIVNLLEELAKNHRVDVNDLPSRIVLKLSRLFNLMEDFKIVRIHDSEIELNDDKSLNNILLVLRDIPIREYVDIAKNIEKYQVRQKINEEISTFKQLIVESYRRGIRHQA